MSSGVVCRKIPKGFLWISFQSSDKRTLLRCIKIPVDISPRLSTGNSPSAGPGGGNHPEQTRRHPAQAGRCGLLWNQWKSIFSIMIASFDQKCTQSRKCRNDVILMFPIHCSWSEKRCVSWLVSADKKLNRIFPISWSRLANRSFSFLIKLYNSDFRYLPKLFCIFIKQIIWRQGTFLSTNIYVIHYSLPKW